MRYWFARMRERADEKYPAQLAYLMEEHGFSRAHANAVVMYCRGSVSSKRHDSVADYMAKLDRTQARTIRAIFTAITERYPDLEATVAWNQPMLKRGAHYVFGVSATKGYLLLGPWCADVTERFAPRLRGYEVNKKTVRVPSDWKPDAALLRAFVKARLEELPEGE